MIEVKGLYKSYGKGYAVKNVSFDIKDGEVIGFLGVNGAGKSTIMNILTGCLSPTAGSIKIDGFDIVDNPVEAKRRIGYLPELPPVYQDMTVKEYLCFMYDLKKVKMPKGPHIDEICRVVKIDNVANRIIKNLSKGYRQRVGIAQALIGNPKVLILDEPTVGLDPRQIIEIRELITRLGKNHTVIISSHILPEIQQIAERILVINKGEIIANGTYTELSEQTAKSSVTTVRVCGPESEVKEQLESLRGVENVSCLGKRELGSFEFKVETDENTDVRKAIFDRMASRKWAILMMRGSEGSLEDLFLSLIDGSVDSLSEEEESDGDVTADTVKNIIDEKIDEETNEQESNEEGNE